MSNMHDNLLVDALSSQLAGLTLDDACVSRLGQMRATCSHKCRALIARILAAGRVEAALPWLILLLADEDESVAGEAVGSIRELLPWTVIRPHEAKLQLEPVLHSAVSFASLQLGPLDMARLMARMAELHGASREISLSLQRFRPEIAEQFGHLAEETLARHYPPQLTVAVTYRCNLKCAYCYASTQRDGEGEVMTADRFSGIVRHASHLGFKRIGFTGGEPTTHPSFKEFIRIVGEQRMTAFFATNGMFRPAMVDSLASEVVGGVTAHVWFSSDFRGQCEEVFTGNLRRMKARGLNVMLRYNKLPGEEVPFDDLERIYSESQACQINLAIAVPNAARKNRHIESHEIISESALLLNAARTMRRRGMRPAFAKPLPSCVPGKGDWRWLGTIPHSVGTCAIWQLGGTHNALINPDGTIWPCIVLNHPLCTFMELKSRQQLSEMSAACLSRIPSHIDDRCSDCSFWKSRRCQGGCLAFSHDRITA